MADDANEALQAERKLVEDASTPQLKIRWLCYALAHSCSAWKRQRLSRAWREWSRASTLASWYARDRAAAALRMHEDKRHREATARLFAAIVKEAKMQAAKAALAAAPKGNEGRDKQEGEGDSVGLKAGACVAVDAANEGKQEQPRGGEQSDLSPGLLPGDELVFLNGARVEGEEPKNVKRAMFKALPHPGPRQLIVRRKLGTERGGEGEGCALLLLALPPGPLGIKVEVRSVGGGDESQAQSTTTVRNVEGESSNLPISSYGAEDKLAFTGRSRWGDLRRALKPRSEGSGRGSSRRGRRKEWSAVITHVDASSAAATARHIQISETEAGAAAAAAMAASAFHEGAGRGVRRRGREEEKGGGKGREEVNGKKRGEVGARGDDEREAQEGTGIPTLPPSVSPIDGSTAAAVNPGAMNGAKATEAGKEEITNAHERPHEMSPQIPPFTVVEAIQALAPALLEAFGPGCLDRREEGGAMDLDAFLALFEVRQRTRGQQQLFSLQRQHQHQQRNRLWRKGGRSHKQQTHQQRWRGQWQRDLREQQSQHQLQPQVERRFTVPRLALVDAFGLCALNVALAPRGNRQSLCLDFDSFVDALVLAGAAVVDAEVAAQAQTQTQASRTSSSSSVIGEGPLLCLGLDAICTAAAASKSAEVPATVAAAASAAFALPASAQELRSAARAEAALLRSRRTAEAALSLEREMRSAW